MATIMLNQRDDMIEAMELDLVAKAQTAFTAANVLANVYGIFSLDDLETKSRNELSSKIAIGVGYAGAEPTAIDTDPKGSVSPGQMRAVRSILFRFAVILAVPTNADCLERYTATQLLSILRRGILGSVIAEDRASRRWSFEKEGPSVDASTEDMAYYVQSWIVSLPINGANV